MTTIDEVAISIVIPNWNGKDLLETNLPVLKNVMRNEVHRYEIVVVDDASSDSSVEYLKDAHPDIHLLALDQQGGFSTAANRGIEAARFDKVLLLNSDIRVTAGFLSPLLPYFSRPDTFAVANKTLDREGKESAIPHALVFKFGMFREEWFPEVHGPSYAFGASGGHALFDRDKILALGGFDESLFSPFYYEDADLSYRAWKRGYKVYYEPRSAVYHDHQASIQKMNPHYVAMVSFRNRYLFLWKNIRDGRLLLEHLIFLPLWLLKFCLRTPIAIPAFFWALTRIPRILRMRRQEAPHVRLSDAECIDMIRKGIKDGVECHPCHEE